MEQWIYAIGEVLSIAVEFAFDEGDPAIGPKVNLDVVASRRFELVRENLKRLRGALDANE